MSALREWTSRLVAFIVRRRGDDVQEELRFHLEMAEQRLRESGLGDEEARRQARLLLGGTTQVAEAYGDQRTLPLAETLLQDLRYAVRSLARAPGLAAAALVTLGLGVGGSTAVFSILNAVLLRPLPYADPDRLVVVGDRDPNGAASRIGYATVQDLRNRSTTLESLVDPVIALRQE